MKLSRISCQVFRTNLVSKLFQPLTLAPANSEKVVGPRDDSQLSKNQKLMLDLGIIRQCQNGFFHVLPLGLRAMNKLKNLVDSHMRNLGAQEISIPHIVDSALWKKSGRWANLGQEVFKLTDRHDRELILNPTHEESAADLMASVPQLSHNQLPIFLYQYSTKFRDEMRPRCGLIRSREFLMKDLYAFDESLDLAKQTYDRVSAAYLKIFNELQLEAIRIEADGGEIGGLASHEFHVACDVGEDTLLVCKTCSHVNVNPISSACELCNGTGHRKVTTLEVGHTFLLGDRYSTPLSAVFADSNNVQQPLSMSSYGLGLSRILAASVECLSTDLCISWPTAIAPYKIVIIPAKDGSNEYSAASRITGELYAALNDVAHLRDDVIIDDRCRLTIGKRVVHAQRTGYPYALVVGRKCVQEPPEIEIIEHAPNAAPFTHSLPIPELVDYFTRLAPARGASNEAAGANVEAKC
ncbi:prolyl-tRNA synthetase [Nesidiocoris tenuis]|uniref:proline--tRNA ligase n=1 Tax=Nesidiocoris tenuis TaxID=355587 RepID=A0ABN7B2W1_9HEMI|nr:prolyl-tRNA synthetase [Nesidiocoris tenuis]